MDDPGAAAAQDSSALIARLQTLAATTDHRLRVVDLCRDLDLSERAFRKLVALHLGTSPARFLRDARLDRARHALAAGAANVTEIAGWFGFGELGQFARHYRERFGETPRETLARAARARRQSPC
jgi:AraC family transcriptional regulator, ethanolamine operon transcriptional activator